MIIDHLLSTVFSFLFPIFASYKALKTSDPAQLTPWLMYWVVFSCGLLVESWTSFILNWIPFYGYIRAIFLLYLVLPQTQGARFIYEEYVHPFLEDNESHIDDFIASAHERLKTESLAYIRQAIEYVKTNVLHLPPTPASAASAPPPQPSGAHQTYSQALLARFSVPAARWSGSANAGADFYNLLAGAVAAASNATGSLTAGSGGGTGAGAGAGSGGSFTWESIIPSNLQSPSEKMSFIAAQRERLNFILNALDKEAQKVQRGEATAGHTHTNRASALHYDGVRDSDNDDNDDGQPTQRPPSGMSMGSSSLSRNRSEADFETIDADSFADEDGGGGGVRRRNAPVRTSSWVPWIWGGSPADNSGSGSGSGTPSHNPDPAGGGASASGVEK